MAENGGWHNHFGVVTPFENLQIRSARQRGFNADAEFTGLKCQRRDILNLNVFPAVEDGRFHAASLESGTRSHKSNSFGFQINRVLPAWRTLMDFLPVIGDVPIRRLVGPEHLIEVKIKMAFERNAFNKESARNVVRVAAAAVESDIRIGCV